MNYDSEVRYSRQINLLNIGAEGHKKIRQAQLLMVGAGGLGVAAMTYLVAAGIGKIAIVDHDRVALSNLQRQVLYETGDIGFAKVQVAQQALWDLNPEVEVIPIQARLDEQNIKEIVEPYPIVLDGSDNFATRYLLNEYCFRHQKTLISAAVQGFSAQLTTFKPYLGEPHPCYECLYPKQLHTTQRNNCSSDGVLGSFAGTIGTWQATEALKEILSLGVSLSGWLLLFDALNASLQKIKLIKDETCLCCS